MRERLDTAPCDHKVLFYPHDHELVRAVATYVASALVEDAVAVVIATPEHREAFDRALIELRCDPAGARAAGSLVMLDAADTLDLFCDADHVPDPVRFDAVVGETVRRAAAGGREVRAFGEMVALLWADGYVTAALELEGLWNGLRREVDFELFCAYPASIHEHGDAEALEHVCRLHSGVVGEGSTQISVRDRMAVSEAVSRSLDHSLTAPGSARLFVRETFARWQLGHLADDAAIIATELVTNATRHADSPAHITLGRVEEGVVITVDDDGGHIPVVRRPEGPELGGRGLRILSVLARDWGYGLRPGGKSVWAFLSERAAT